MVAQLRQLENYSVWSEMHEVWADNVVCAANPTPGVANCPHRKNLISSQRSSFMRFLVVVQDEGWPILCSLANKRQEMNQIAGTWVYISLLPTNTSTLISSHFKYTTSILNYRDITWLAQNNASCSKTHSITYTTLYISSGLSSAIFNCIIMLMPWM